MSFGLGELVMDTIIRIFEKNKRSFEIEYDIDLSLLNMKIFQAIILIYSAVSASIIRDDGLSRMRLSKGYLQNGQSHRRFPFNGRSKRRVYGERHAGIGYKSRRY